MPLFAYQRQGVAFFEGRNGRALLADEMGLGKTIQTIAWLRHRRWRGRSSSSAVPALGLNWQREIRAWLGEKAYLPVLTKADASGYAGQPFATTHHDISSYWIDWLRELKPRVVVVDEAHYIKSNAAMRTQAVKALVKGVLHLIGLTGTPIVNRLVEAFNIIKLIDKTAIPNWLAYTRRHRALKFNGFAWTFNGATKTKELHHKLVGPGHAAPP